MSEDNSRYDDVKILTHKDVEERRKWVQNWFDEDENKEETRMSENQTIIKPDESKEKIKCEFLVEELIVSMFGGFLFIIFGSLLPLVKYTTHFLAILFVLFSLAYLCGGYITKLKNHLITNPNRFPMILIMIYIGYVIYTGFG